MKNKVTISPKAIILFTVFLDVLGLGVIIPILPFYVESFNVSETVVICLLFLPCFLFLVLQFWGQFLIERVGGQCF